MFLFQNTFIIPLNFMVNLGIVMMSDFDVIFQVPLPCPFKQ